MPSFRKVIQSRRTDLPRRVDGVLAAMPSLISDSIESVWTWDGDSARFAFFSALEIVANSKDYASFWRLRMRKGFPLFVSGFH
jgi:hypothetical protein